ncbi:transcriptional regulator [Neptunitalea chrysea]|uniref:Transcriptional regulator n=1 Tax=Neptunitalea chrysea TaxID=1647581 RepID=A0A9W6EW09_9FLAO|nr:helix-turn-helix domain-containing protein [Neptunitalea chrysea]GLB52253.1 transcriptional regulator [Neptunitalea chrysea]
MEKSINFYNVAECPVRNVLDKIGDKWSLLILLVLKENEVLRFNEIHKSIGDISQKMLSVTLKSLEADGFVHRKVYAEIPPKVEYTITPLGTSLLPHIDALAKWSKEHINTIMQNRAAYNNEL